MSRMRDDGARPLRFWRRPSISGILLQSRNATSSVDAIAAKGWPAKLPQDADHAWAGLTRLPRRPARLGEFEHRKSNF
jgi:hypothetical protein